MKDSEDLWDEDLWWKAKENLPHSRKCRYLIGGGC